uniref:Rcorf105 n=1 Tax=Rhizobium rhizogenes TaxID=359 RepID=A8W0F2_RHIRH|nr:rcorf105 [Rhizobium rhizogenes]
MRAAYFCICDPDEGAVTGANCRISSWTTVLSSNGPSERPSKAKSEWETGPRRSGEAWCDGDGIAIGRSMARRIDRDEHRRLHHHRPHTCSFSARPPSRHAAPRGEPHILQD